jgi:endoglucanase
LLYGGYETNPAAAFKPGTCAAGAFTGTGSLTESGALIRSRIRTADNF